MGRGALVFKGEKAKKKKKKRKHSSDKQATVVSNTGESRGVASLPAAASALHKEPEKKRAVVSIAPKIQEGTGLITTSGTVVTGHDTRFQRELAVGDAILVNVATSQGGNQQEMRVITMCLSNASLNLSSSFSENFSTPTPFQYIRKPRNKARESASAKQKAVEDSALEGRQASGMYGTDELVYREKTEHGSYRIRRVEVDDNDVTRGDLLQMRTKKKSDKYC